ncbi:unnamed protein product [Caenorhabditis bovis]|uniref:39S ribosomal protein L52, mitochondrial n=1 Tax=Caenorhabditis bovis TaxID=2654633 RepID=A0A8S1FA66_9PELO|nr:unnamed protein product [Caenorhabditis bovis]
MFALSSFRTPIVAKASRISLYSTINVDFKDEIKEEEEKLVVRKPIPKNSSKIQSWRKPVYYAPHQHVFEQSPDFSFKDGRTVHVTSQKQLDYKLDQIRLAKKIVSLLKETQAVEEIYKKEVAQKEAREKEEAAKRPIEKGKMMIA